MKTNIRLTLSSLFWAMVLLLAYAAAAQPQTKVNDTRDMAAQKKRASQSSIAGATTPVTGGTTGYLTKWVGVPGASVIGDTTVFEDKFGRVCIGATTLSSKLTVQGMIETTLGGYKIPDGTIQIGCVTKGGELSEIRQKK